MTDKETNKLIESLSPNERRIIPYLQEKDLENLIEKSGLDKISSLRALEYLQNKGIVIIKQTQEKIVSVGVNGARYKKNSLPERILLETISKKRILNLEDAKKQSNLSEDEFKAAIGVLKKKAMIDIKNQKLVLNASANEITKKSLEELFIESLPLKFSDLTAEQKFAFRSLEKRKEILFIEEKKQITFELTDLGKQLITLDLKGSNLIEQITPEILRKSLWKNKKFRRYDVSSKVPEIYGGKRHFVNQAIGYGKKIWTDMGFKEMVGTIVLSSFWNFDALFTAQDHPVRELQDTFYLDKKISAKLPDKELVRRIKQVHETGLNTGDEKSKGWQYSWNEEDAKRLVLRTHTTCLSAQTLAEIGKNKTKLEDKNDQGNKNNLKGKYFAIGRCFRNETVDWSHGFEFNQTEGIVIDPNANFRHLLGYLKQFFKKMGLNSIKFVPSYFPYTEPSVEIYAYNKDKKAWIEVGGAGIFRPEVTIPLLGTYVPVLAWGPGFDRILMNYYQIKDLREVYKNNLTDLRNKKTWIK